MKAKVFTFLGLVTAMLLTGCTKEDSSKIIKFQVLKAGLGTEVYEKLASAYQEEHPGVKVKIIFNYDVNADVDKHLTTGKCSDIYSIRDISAIKRYYAKGQIIDLKDVVYNAEIENGKTLLDLIDSQAANYCEYNGHYICVPEYVNVNGFVYNKKLFDQYGWEIPNTTEEMQELAERIIRDTGDTVKPFVTCNAADGYFYYLLNGIVTSYQGIANMDKIYEFENAEIFNPANRTDKLYALQTMKNWYLEGNNLVVKGSIGYDHIQAQTALLDGKAAMMLNGSWFENEMSAYIDYSKHDLGMFRVPEYSIGGVVQHAEGYTTEGDKKIINCEYTANYIIPSAAANREGAIDFLKFINRSDMSILYTKTCNTVRPFNYNKDSSSADYAGMRSFGKSVLDMANNNTSYVPVSKSQLVISAGISFWPLTGDNYHIKAMLRNNEEPIDALRREYNYAKTLFQ